MNRKLLDQLKLQQAEWSQITRYPSRPTSERLEAYVYLGDSLGEFGALPFSVMTRKELRELSHSLDEPEHRRVAVGEVLNRMNTKKRHKNDTEFPINTI